MDTKGELNAKRITDFKLNDKSDKKILSNIFIKRIAMIALFLFVFIDGVHAQMGAKKLYDALKAKNLKYALSLIQNVKDVNYSDNDRISLLMLASFNGYTDVCKILINKGANLDLKSSWGQTALMIASSFGHKEIVKLLIENGADTQLKSSFGYTASDYAEYYRKFEEWSDKNSYKSCITTSETPQGMFDKYFNGFDKINIPLDNIKYPISILLVKRMNKIGTLIFYYKNNHTGILKPEKGYTFVRIIFNYSFKTKPIDTHYPILWAECIKLFNNEHVYTPIQMIGYEDKNWSSYAIDGLQLKELNNIIAVNFTVRTNDLNNLNFQVNEWIQNNLNIK